MKNRIKNMAKAASRKEAMEQGAYDGRYKSRVVPDKKKAANKKLARKKVI